MDVEPDEEVMMDGNVVDAEVENILKINLTKMNDDNMNDFKLLGTVGKYTLDFVRSLIYLSDVGPR